jgi:hypothetical protein
VGLAGLEGVGGTRGIHQQEVGEAIRIPVEGVGGLDAVLLFAGPANCGVVGVEDTFDQAAEELAGAGLVGGVVQVGVQAF